MKKKKSKKGLFQLISEAWMDLKVKLFVIAILFISSLAVVFLVIMDVQNDKKLLESKANKYETYIDQLLLGKFTVEELKEMSPDQIKLAVDMVIDEENNKVINAPTLNDFILPVKNSDYATMFELTREPKKRWTQEEIEQFWIDLDSLDIKNLEENNFEYLKARLKDIR